MTIRTYTLCHRRQSGFSLIEVMVASLIGLILLGSLMHIMIDTSSNHREVARAGQLLENGRYAIHLLTHELEHAGFFDQFDAPALPTAAPDPCATTLNALKDGMSFAVQGFDAQSAGFVRPTCIPEAAYRPGTDVLVVRRAATTETAVADVNATEYYLQSKFDDYVLELGQNASSFTLANPMNSNTLPIRKYRVDLFFISQCSDFTGNTCQDDIPTLKRLELAAGPKFELVTLAEGVEDLQLYFGVDSLPVGALDGTPDRDASGKLYVSNPGDLSTVAGREAWANVVAVQLYLLTRDVTAAPGYADKKTYVLSPAELNNHTVLGNDAPYKRQVFSSQIRIVNISSRREG